MTRALGVGFRVALVARAFALQLYQGRVLRLGSCEALQASYRPTDLVAVRRESLLNLPPGWLAP